MLAGLTFATLGGGRLDATPNSRVQLGRICPSDQVVNGEAGHRA
jgi:hypothetical protein